MKQPESSFNKAERLLTLTLVIEEAVASGRIEDLDSLLIDRQTLLDDLSESTIDAPTASTLSRVREAEESVFNLLARTREGFLGDLRGMSTTKQGLKSYQRQQSA